MLINLISVSSKTDVVDCEAPILKAFFIGLKKVMANDFVLFF